MNPHTASHPHTTSPYLCVNDHTCFQVVYAEGVDDEHTTANVGDVLDRASKTTLIQFFANNVYEWGLRYQETGTTSRPRGYELTYTNYPKFYKWDKAKKCWGRRKNLLRGSRGSYIGRMRYVPPTPAAMQTFYLRMLLHVTKGPLNFEDLRKVDGVLHANYKQACFAHGMIEDGQEWELALREAAATQMAPHSYILSSIGSCKVVERPCRIYGRRFCAPARR